MKCVSYTRTMPWKNHKGELTIADQNQRIAEYLAEHKEMDLQKKYSDRKGVENASAAFDKMIDDGAERKFDCIIVASMYYCGPGFPAARQSIKETLYETGVDLIVLEEGLDTRTASRKEVEDYFEEKRCEMHAEIMFAWRKKQGAGFRLTNSVPYGYIRRNGESNMVKDEEVAPYLSEAFSRYASGQKMRDIAKWLNEQNVEPPMRHKKRIQGKPYEGESDLWTSDNLRGLFRNPTYTGATANGSRQIIAEKAGYKYHLTKDYLKHLQKSLMDICQREGLHQVDLLSPAPDRISPQEYYAKQRGQQNLDIANMELMIEGITPMHTTFETGKEKIRNAISDIAERATSFEEFQRLLKAEYGISVKDHRGRFSYLPADRQKYISARALGSNYDRDKLLRILAENARTAEQNNPHWAVDDPMAILFIKSDLRLVVDLQTCVKAQQSRAYAQKVKISNLQQMARTVAYVQEHGYDSREKLSETADAIYTKMAKARGDAKLTESKLRKTNEQIHYLGQYLSTKSIYGEFLKAPNKKIFRQAHSDELAQYEEALQILKQHSPDGKFPTMKDLRAEKEQLTIQKDAQYDTYHYFKDYHKELQTVCANVDSILGTEQEVQQHEQQHTRKYEPSL